MSDLGQRKVWRGIKRGRAAAALVVLCFALVQRVTFRDSVRGVDLLFYGLPFPVIAAGAFGLAGHFAWRRRWWGCGAAAVILLLAVPLWWSRSYFRNAPVNESSDFTIQYWNAARAKSPERVVEGVTQRSGDIIALVEAGGDRVTPTMWSKHLPGYDVRKLEGGMLLAVRGSIRDVEYTVVGGRRARFNVARVELAATSQSVTVVMVDIHSNPLYDKERPFDRLTQIVRSMGDEPVVVAGDFNTLLESVQYDKLRAAGLTHAFEERGNGFVETYAFNLPLLAIDHVWLGPALQTVTATKSKARGSDHQALMVGVGLTNQTVK